MSEVIEATEQPAKRLPKKALPATATPTDLLRIAVEQGADLDKLERLMALQERWEATEARKAYVAAMAAFKADPPRIVKNKPVSFGTTNYKHATLDEAVNAISPKLSAQGLSFQWFTSQDGGTITVRCVMRHVLGHSEEVSLSSGEDKSGGKNAIQAVGSTVTYLQRYTLFAITGLAAEDDDGRGSEAPQAISEVQAATLKRLLQETDSDVAAFLRWIKAETVDAMPADKYETALARLEAKKAAK